MFKVSPAACDGCFFFFFSLLSGLVEREVLAGAAGEQVGGGGVCDGAADSHGKR